MGGKSVRIIWSGEEQTDAGDQEESARYQHRHWQEYLDVIGHVEYPELTWDQFLEQRYPQFRPQQRQPEAASSSTATRVRRHHIGAFQKDTDVLYREPRWHEYLLLIDYAEFPELTWERFLRTRYPSSVHQRDDERERHKCNTHYARVAGFHQLQRSRVTRLRSGSSYTAAEAAAGADGQTGNGGEMERPSRRGSGWRAAPAGRGVGTRSSADDRRSDAAGGVGGVGRRHTNAAGGHLVPHRRSAKCEMARKSDGEGEERGHLYRERWGRTTTAGTTGRRGVDSPDSVQRG